GTLDARELVTTLAIQLNEQLAATRKLWRLRQISLMARAARGLNKLCGKNRLFPCQSGFMRFSHFRSCALAAMANRAAPITNVVGNRRGGGDAARKRLGPGGPVWEVPR